ncbi:hypothetical protein [Leptothoe sp. PORK10 BA2]|uniref:hypothetical protein n=1 Tax=Leptothoe sp. PORK10 BA2 TaxID=3110254 RepID=UPI002B1E9BB5|nr:hypothetical protein [Leptothoe sp. PORK10 BA2]MEA5466898.1 hypothetical protein [Leptothoe sp. PORK10 BA2]
MAVVWIGQSLPANAIKKYINVQPIEICDNLGGRCAGTPIFASETKAIWEKAGLDINFLPTRQLNESLFLIATETAIDYGLFSGIPRTGVSSDPKTINVWFAQDLFYHGGTRFGRGSIGGNKLVLNSSAISSFNGGKGRIDTLAHELGHNLGLFHHHDENHLLAAGDQRQSPESLLDITTNQTSLFSQQEISTVFASPFVKDIPRIIVEGGSANSFGSENLWTVKFLSGSEASLTRLTLDLSSVGETFKSASAISGLKNNVFQLGNMSGISADAIAITEEKHGDLKLVLDFTKGDFTLGDSFDFGIDPTLFPALENLGFTPDGLTGSALTLELSDGYRILSQLRTRALEETDTPTENIPVANPQTVEPTLELESPSAPVVTIEPSPTVTIAQMLNHGAIAELDHIHGAEIDESGSHAHNHSHGTEGFHEHDIEDKDLLPVVSIEPLSPVVSIEPLSPVGVGVASGDVTEAIHDHALGEDNTTLSFEFASDIVIPLPARSGSHSPISVPEPSGLLGIAWGGLVWMRSRRQDLAPKQQP